MKIIKRKIKAVYIRILYWLGGKKVDFSDMTDEGIIQYYEFCGRRKKIWKI